MKNIDLEIKKNELGPTMAKGKVEGKPCVLTEGGTTWCGGLDIEDGRVTGGKVDVNVPYDCL
ncbi:MAG: hypothetical protein HRU25_03550 [Psychrobium sp.]|nr:hypothetical protein [Psychrobium sp.]